MPVDVPQSIVQVGKINSDTYINNISWAWNNENRIDGYVRYDRAECIYAEYDSDFRFLKLMCGSNNPYMG